MGRKSLQASNGADLYICECFSFAPPIGYHMAWSEIEKNLDRFGAKRVLLTHMNADMLARSAEIATPACLWPGTACRSTSDWRAGEPWQLLSIG